MFAYIQIGTTPFQALFAGWGLVIVVSTDHTIMSLTQLEFFAHYIPFVMLYIDWVYTWFWNDLLDLVLALPIVLIQSFEAVFTTWLGFWILKKLN